MTAFEKVSNIEVLEKHGLLLACLKTKEVERIIEY